MEPTSPNSGEAFAGHVEELRQFLGRHQAVFRALFEKQSPIFVARAPGRLDVMGGIGDYSGSLVLELPIAEAAFAAVQTSQNGSITISSLRENGRANITSSTIAADEWARLRSADCDSARQFFVRDPHSAWIAYVAGVVLVLLRETQSRFAGGLRILIDSNVPEGKGVSSSAAIEVATMRAVAELRGIDLPGAELARLCQLAENRVVGAPCGIMDQMTSALGRANHLLALRCQPAAVEGFVRVPAEVAFWGIDSGIRHAVSGSDYSSVRCGAFMGYRIMADIAGLQAKRASDAPHVVEVDDPLWNGYLANVTPREFDDRFASEVPIEISGREFLDHFGGTTDRVTHVDPARVYRVRSATRHPIEENERAAQFRRLLEGPIDAASLGEMGRLMAAAHASYSACGLGSEGTDLLVNLARDAGPNSGLYGAKITGGGSGGAVAIVGRSDADRAVQAVAERYTELTGRKTHVFRGSSPGAYGTPVGEFVI